MQHRTTPHQRPVSGIDEAHRDHLDAVRFQRLDLILTYHPWLHIDAHHKRHIRTIDIRIEQSDFVSQLRQRDCQIHRDGGLSHSTLARSHCNDVLDSGQRHRLCLRRPCMHMSH